VVHLIRFLSESPDETRDLGRKIGTVLAAGDVVALRGDLGTGKSVLARGILDSLGVEGDMPSPSFVIVASYDAPVRVNHIDLYRLENPGEALDLGLHDLLHSDAVCVVEWAERLAGFLPSSAIDVEIRAGEGADQRLVTIGAGDDDVKRRLTGLAGELVRFSRG
jgi:tRNA threonylcarbamoyladenosine biosynthesis protein TsaE